MLSIQTISIYTDSKLQKWAKLQEKNEKLKTGKIILKINVVVNQLNEKFTCHLI
jgi:hypothetical protein